MCYLIKKLKCGAFKTLIIIVTNTHLKPTMDSHSMLTIFEQAIILYEKREYDQALNLFRIIKNNPKVLYHQGKCYYALRQYANSIHCYQQCINYQPADLDQDLIYQAHLAQGSAECSLKKYMKAILCFDQIPDDCKYVLSKYHNKGLCYDKLLLGFCHDRKLFRKLAENCYRQVVELSRLPIEYDNKKYFEDLAFHWLTTHFIDDQRIDDLIQLYSNNINQIINGRYTLLTCVIQKEAYVIAEQLIKIGANPFLGTHIHNTAFYNVMDPRFDPKMCDGSYTRQCDFLPTLLSNYIDRSDNQSILDILKKLINLTPQDLDIDRVRFEEICQIVQEYEEELMEKTNETLDNSKYIFEQICDVTRNYIDELSNLELKTPEVELIMSKIKELYQIANNNIIVVGDHEQ